MDRTCSTHVARTHEAVARVADGIRELLELPGLEVMLIDLDEHQEHRRLGRPPYRRVQIDLGEARNVLYRLAAPRDDRDATMTVAALLARDLAPVRDQDAWDLLVPRISWVLGRLGCRIERAVEIADTVAQADGLD